MDKNLFRFILCIPYINLKVLPKGNQQADIVAFNTHKLELLAGSTTEKNPMIGKHFFPYNREKINFIMLKLITSSVTHKLDY